MRRLTSLGSELGFEVRTKMGMHPKVFWKFAFEDGTPGKIKLEPNTYERSPMLPLTTRDYRADSPFCSGSAAVPTFQAEEASSDSSVLIRIIARHGHGAQEG